MSNISCMFRQNKAAQSEVRSRNRQKEKPSQQKAVWLRPPSRRVSGLASAILHCCQSLHAPDRQNEKPKPLDKAILQIGVKLIQFGCYISKRTASPKRPQRHRQILCSYRRITHHLKGIMACGGSICFQTSGKGGDAYNSAE